MFGLQPGELFALEIVVAVILIIGLIYVTWRYMQTSFRFADFVARVFMLRKWKKNTAGLENPSNWEKDLLPAPEKQLCEYYLRFAHASTLTEYENAADWLKATGQESRRPMSLWLWAMLFVLTAGEASGTGFVLANTLSTSMTGNEGFYYAFVIAVVTAIGLLFLTHAAGKEAAFREAVKQNLGDSIETEAVEPLPINPGDDYRIDQDMDFRQRWINRVMRSAHDRGSRKNTIWTIVILSALLIGIFAVRYKANEVYYYGSILDNTAVGCSASSGASSSGSSDPFQNLNNPPPASTSSGSIPGMPPGTGSPPSVTCDAEQANGAGSDSISKATEVMDNIGALVLGLFYIMVQFVGFVLARRHGFLGDGQKAFNITLGYTSYNDLYNWRLKPVYQRANHCLQILRTYFISRIDGYRMHPAKMDVAEYAERRYKNKFIYNGTDDEIENRIGVNSYLISQDFRNRLRERGKKIGDCPASLQKYKFVHEQAMREHETQNALHKITSEQRVTDARKAQSVEPQAAEPRPTSPTVVELRPSSSALPVTQPSQMGQTDLSGYAALDIEMAEELLRAPTLIDRKRILNDLCEGDEAKKAIVQEIYAKLKLT